MKCKCVISGKECRNDNDYRKTSPGQYEFEVNQFPVCYRSYHTYLRHTKRKTQQVTIQSRPFINQSYSKWKLKVKHRKHLGSQL